MFKRGDRVIFENIAWPSRGTVEGVLEIDEVTQKVIVKWDDGFDDGEGNVFEVDELDYEGDR